MDDRPESVDEPLRAEADQTEEIRADIEQTRAELSETVNAIQDRLRPGNLAARATKNVREATVGKVKEMTNTAGEKATEVLSQTREAAGGLVEQAREHPVQAALIGLAAAWLLKSLVGRRGESDTFDDEWRQGDEAELRGVEWDEWDEEAGFGRAFVDRVRGNPLPAALAGIGLAWLAAANRRGNGETDDYSTGYAGAIGTHEESESNMVGTGGAELGVQPGGRVSSYRPARRTRGFGRRVGDQARRMMQENPLAICALTTGVGAAIGFLIPQTARENRLMGEARDTVVDRAQEAARDVGDRVKEAAEEVRDAADRAVKTVTRTDL